MTTSTDWTTNGADFVNRATSAATSAATKAVADTVVKTATETTAKASQAVVDNATAAVETARKAARTIAENNAAVTTAFGKATTAVAEMTIPSTGTGPVSFESVNRQIEQAVQAVAAQGKQAGTAWLDAYDKGFAVFVQLRKDLAGAAQVEAVKTLAEHNTKALEQLNTAYTAAIRDLLQ